MKQYAAGFLAVSFLTMEAAYVWVIWSDGDLVNKVALSALIVFANALLFSLGMLL